MAKPMDGVIEAIRYKNGQVALARVYERRGKAYSDCVMLDRKTLLERLQKGQTYAVGAREAFRAGTFKTGKSVKIVKQDGREFLATREDATRDEIEDASFF